MTQAASSACAALGASVGAGVLAAPNSASIRASIRPVLARIDHRDGLARGMRVGDDGPFPPAGGLADHPHGRDGRRRAMSAPQPGVLQTFP